MVSFTPQLIKIWRGHDADAVSLRMYAITVTGFSLWVAYGVLLVSWPIIVTNSVCLALSAAILALKWRYSRSDGPRVAPGAGGEVSVERRRDVAHEDSR